MNRAKAQTICFTFLIVTFCITCKTPITVITEKPLSVQPVDSLVQHLLSKPSLSWIDGRANVTLLIEGSVQKFSSQIRIKRDSIFLANGKKLSVEGGRIQITKDSFYYINRIDKTFLIDAYDSFAENYNIPFGFEDLMNVLIGDPIHNLENASLASYVIRKMHMLRQEDQKFQVDYFFDPVHFRLRELHIRDLFTDRKGIIEYDDYKETEQGISFPYIRNFIFHQNIGQKISLEVDFSKIDLNAPKAIKFSIPPSYSQIQ
ncbi:MAG: DUF4292 domain-containing protein [Bacteroidia bacterium]|nr:DUF4292 domain-containing protein [Bacteroidia bacterium]